MTKQMENDLGFQLMAHQVEAIQRARDLRDFALFFDMGAGKTCTTIQILREKYKGRGRLMPTLILAPLAVVSNWKKEFEKFSKIPLHRIIVLQGAGVECVKVIEKTIANSPESIIIVNYEKLLSKQIFEKLLDWHPEIIVCDESHLCKSHKSKRSKNVEQLADQAKHRYILTGTPILNSALDIFQQFRILDKGDTFTDNFYIFQGRYFEDRNAKWKGNHNYFPNWQAKDSTYDDLHGLIYRKAMRVKKSECLDLPPFVRQEIEVSLGKEQARLYKSMKQDFIAYLNQDTGELSKAATAQIALTKALRLQQIVTGFVKDENGDIFVIEDNPRIAAFSELLETLVHEHKVIVWATFRENYKLIASCLQKLEVKFVEIHGAVSHKDRDEAAYKFNNDPDIKVIIANQRAAGLGLNLTASDYMVYFSKSFSLGDDEQSEARNYRKGSEIHDKVTRIDIVCRDTIDEIINNALKKKQDISQQIIELKSKLLFDNQY